MTLGSIGVNITQTILPIATTGLITLLGYGVAFLRKQIAKINNQVERSALDAAIIEAEKVSIDAIRATNQTFVDEIKKSSADGKLTKEEAVAAMNIAQKYFVSHISKSSLKVLNAALGPIGAWLKDYLEAKLKQNKELNKLINPPF